MKAKEKALKLPDLSALRALLFVLTLSMGAGGASADSDSALATVLGKQEPPAGVVFEVVQGDPDGLNWAIPRIRGYIDQLRRRFPDIPIAVISHGQEQFSLLQENSRANEATHSLAKAFLAEEETAIQVCGNHAGMYGHGADDYPDYVEVVDAAPRQVRRYKEKGYDVVVVRTY